MKMFEKYSEDALRSLFHARRAVSEHGGAQIEPEHIVLGVLTGAPTAVQRFVATQESTETLRARLVAQVPAGERVSEGAEIPFAEGTKEALHQTAIEADELKGGHIEPEHLLLGVLVKTSGAAADALHEAGVEIRAIRQFLQASAEG